MTDAYDFVAIGSGPAGESAAELATFFGHRSAVIEKARPGGTVTTTGGVPTKTLREAALYFSGLCEGGIYGLRTAAPAEVAIDIIRKRTWEVCGLLQKGTAENLARNHVDYIEGEAFLQRDGAVKVAGRDGRERELRAKTILIATGSAPPAKEHLIRHPGCLRYGYDPESRAPSSRHPHCGWRASRRRVRYDLSCPRRKSRYRRPREPVDPGNGWRTLRVDGRPVP